MLRNPSHPGATRRYQPKSRGRAKTPKAKVKVVPKKQKRGRNSYTATQREKLKEDYLAQVQEDGAAEDEELGAAETFEEYWPRRCE